MKPIPVADLQADVESFLDLAQKERLVIMRNGKPSAVVVGVEAYEKEDWQLAPSAAFWQMIEDRRGGRSIPLAEVKARLRAKKTARRSSPGDTRAKKKATAGDGVRR